MVFSPSNQPPETLALAFAQRLDEPEGKTVGRLARYGAGRARRCGELSRTHFNRQPSETALCNDLRRLGVEDETDRAVPPFRSPAKALIGDDAHEIPRLTRLGRLAEAGAHPRRLTTRRVSQQSEHPAERPPPAGWPVL